MLAFTRSVTRSSICLAVGQRRDPRFEDLHAALQFGQRLQMAVRHRGPTDQWR